MFALVVVVAHPFRDVGFEFADRIVAVEPDAFVFQAAPETLDEDVVHPAGFEFGGQMSSFSFLFRGRLSGLYSPHDQLVSSTMLWLRLAGSLRSPLDAMAKTHEAGFRRYPATQP